MSVLADSMDECSIFDEYSICYVGVLMNYRKVLIGWTLTFIKAVSSVG